MTPVRVYLVANRGRVTSEASRNETALILVCSITCVSLA